MSKPLRQTDLKREAVLQAAIHEFRLHGFEASSMDKIAATAGVSKRTVYNHFPSKEELFSAILTKLWQQASAQNELKFQTDLPMREQLVEFLSNKMRLLCDPHFTDLARVAIAATIHTPDRAREIVQRMSQREEAIVSWIKAAQSAGKLNDGEPNLMGDMLQGQLKSLAFWPQVTMGQAPLNSAEQQSVIELSAALFLAYYARSS